jgi:hypothetical protein
MQLRLMVSGVCNGFGLQMEGKGRCIGDEGSIMWKFCWFSGRNTAFSTTSERFRDRHEPNEARNMREIRSLNRFSIRERERGFEGDF